MLIGFSLRNFRSFLDEQSFHFTASPDDSHESTHCMRTGMKSSPRLLRSAIVFGPNGSGKTNFVAALHTLRDLVVHSTSRSDAQFAELHTPFQFGPSIAQPTEFHIDLLVGKVRYRYSVAFDARRICAERLLVYKTGKAQRWFERRFDSASGAQEWSAFSPSFNGPREMWRKATRDKSLFLTTAARLNSEQLKPLLHWFEHRLQIVFPWEASEPSSIAACIQDGDCKGRVLRLMRTVGMKVDDVRMADRDAPAEAAMARSAASIHSAYPHVPQVEFLHSSPGSPPAWLESEFEAAGIHRLFALSGPLLAAIESGKLLVVDDFDTNFHPLVAGFLVQFINNPKVSNQGAQLLLISHTTTLMDLHMLRRDEIWLTELDASHATVLSTILRSSPRKKEQIARGYLSGRYGAIPDIRPELYLAPAAGAAKSNRAKLI